VNWSPTPSSGSSTSALALSSFSDQDLLSEFERRGYARPSLTRLAAPSPPAVASSSSVSTASTAPTPPSLKFRKLRAFQARSAQMISCLRFLPFTLVSHLQLGPQPLPMCSLPASLHYILVMVLSTGGLVRTGNFSIPRTIHTFLLFFLSTLSLLIAPTLFSFASRIHNSSSFLLSSLPSSLSSSLYSGEEYKPHSGLILVRLPRVVIP